ncbi:YhcN/YlaJ family sporulation lipoprotein [Heyndrickxia ginsengihumi]|uniref:Sporulation protein n=1 Tax=Heyndrickxia ginsengihumi TaxID=363870 RepID=A0A0A6XYF2_9BACI|nr:YhcN/YlaJ family sporulation lipoprotein [Heyndrickxia ginsengihumi]KHD85177.1 sporulation protein [Heyndrickxia ginsengihumi]MBE6185621.1 sporulation protein [Bacillus sp. (in: firmicutes)]MCM3024590.1 YhcN/YlaJ family sporulation lipoprotein [Heyndrickxia ginsengihumi]NEY18799.1 sporulation protein [Heyndrickxia ginsengihumi]
MEKFTQKLLLCLGLSMITVSSIGCDSSPNKDSQMALIKTTKPEPIKLTNKSSKKHISEELRSKILHFDSIYDVAMIEENNQILVAYKVRHLHRFKMDKIEKDLTSYLEKNYPDKKFIVSSDYKIFLETVRLQEKMESKKISDKQARKRFKEIVKLKKELT